jgi:hypothetical protein
MFTFHFWKSQEVEVAGGGSRSDVVVLDTPDFAAFWKEFLFSCEIILSTIRLDVLLECMTVIVFGGFSEIRRSVPIPGTSLTSQFLNLCAFHFVDRENATARSVVNLADAFNVRHSSRLTKEVRAILPAAIALVAANRDLPGRFASPKRLFQLSQSVSASDLATAEFLCRQAAAHDFVPAIRFRFHPMLRGPSSPAPWSSITRTLSGICCSQTLTPASLFSGRLRIRHRLC